MGTKLRLFILLFRLIVKKPIESIRHINISNIYKLKKALEYESPSSILINFKNLLLNSRSNDGNVHQSVLSKAELDFLINKISIDQSHNTFEKAENNNYTKSTSPIKTIAFYLPQFHQIPENDKWWGEGFTEWTNVISAKPIFKGHYQPHLPSELGFYDLRIPKNMEKQIEIAKSFGIHGFCFYKYWFDGKELLEKPLEMFLNHPEWDINFCLIWANENWTRTWDGLDKEVLIAQKHSSRDDLSFIKNIKKYITDPRYIKVNNKPVILIYRPHLFPNIKKTIKIWRDYCCTENIGELHIGMAQTFKYFDPRKYDLDFAVEFPPHNFPMVEITDNFAINGNFKGHIYDCSSLLKKLKKQKHSTGFTLYKTAMMNWDNSARKKLKANIYLGISPDIFQDWFSYCCSYVLKNNDANNRFVFINAWNEWAEGTHLEPCKKWGYSYLNRISKVLSELTIKGNMMKRENNNSHLFNRKT